MASACLMKARAVLGTKAAGRDSHLGCPTDPKLLTARFLLLQARGGRQGLLSAHNALDLCCLLPMLPNQGEGKPLRCLPWIPGISQASCCRAMAWSCPHSC